MVMGLMKGQKNCICFETANIQEYIGYLIGQEAGHQKNIHLGNIRAFLKKDRD